MTINDLPENLREAGFIFNDGEKRVVMLSGKTVDDIAKIMNPNEMYEEESA